MNRSVEVFAATSVELRRAMPIDRETLVGMYLSFEPKGALLGLPPRKEPQRWLDKLAVYPNFVVYVEGRLAGHAALCLDGDWAEVAIFVHQGYRRRGLGTLLLKELINEAQRLGLRRLWGMAEPDNVPMFRLAYSLGFVPGSYPGEFSLDLKKLAHLSEALTPAA